MLTRKHFKGAVEIIKEMGRTQAERELLKKAFEEFFVKYGENPRFNLMRFEKTLKKD